MLSFGFCVAQDANSGRKAGIENPLGWEWLLKPTPLTFEKGKFPDRPHQAGEHTVHVTRRWTGGVRVRLDSPSGEVKTGVQTDFRAVLLDHQGNRYVHTHGTSSSDRRATVRNMDFPPEAPAAASVAFLAVEMLTPKGRKILAADAQRRARAAGVELLPLPEVGEPFEFELTTIDGKKIRSADCRGDIVLVDCWATWCTPCMAKMPKLKSFHAKWKDHGLRIVGVNYDQDVEKARKAVRDNKLDWPMVSVPANSEARQLWQEANGIIGLPRLLVLDAGGVLRTECRPDDLEATLEALLETRGDQPRKAGP